MSETKEVGLSLERASSLFTMLKLHAPYFTRLLVLIGKLHVIFGSAEDSVVDDVDLPKAIGNIDSLIKVLETLKLPVSIATAKRLRLRYVPGTKWGDLKHMVSELENAFPIELNATILLAINEAKYADLYLQPNPLFGSEVFDKFPSANEDISEAGKCLALDRGTACVMHLNRALEVGLQALASALGVSKQNNWGLYLLEIRNKLDARAAAKTSDPNETFYREAQVMLDAVRIAWRNPTMHIEQSYTVEKAEDIFTSVRTLMKHLATKLTEVP